jgi:hypothetical protein
MKSNRSQDPIDFADAQKIFIEKGWMVPEMMLEYEKRSNVGYLLNIVEQRLKKPFDTMPKTVVLQPPVKPFTLSSECFHTLNTFQYQQNLTLSFYDKIFQYSFEQLAFLSPLVLSHYMVSSDPFNIEIKRTKSQEFLNCFVQLDSLLRQSSSLKINSQNVKVFSKIAESLDNSFLMECCESFFGKEDIEFSFSSIHLSRLSFPTKKFLRNFTFNINNMPILINHSLFFCASDLLFHVDLFYQSFF